MKAGLCGLLSKESGSIPLTNVKVFAVVIGRGTKVRVTQEFKNTEENPIEVIYKFPLPESATLCGFKAIIGEKTVTGFVEERDKAFEAYDDALIDGEGAYLLDQERPNIFTLSLGNMNPNSSATIEIEYIMLLETHDKEVRFFLPTTISPRYIPNNILDDDGIPIDEKINPNISLDVPYNLSISICIKNSENIEVVESPSHAVITNLKSSDIIVEFSSKTVKMDRDFVLDIRYKKRFESYGYLYSDKDKDFLQIDCSFPEENLSVSADKVVKRTNKEIIFVLDCSGSMEGSSIIQAKQAIEIFLKGLENGINFNIYRFGSDFQKLFNSSAPYTQGNLKKALKYISNTEANLGGTEILRPLQDIYNNSRENSKDIILITDGEVGNEYEVINLAKERRGRNRIFIVGIGYGQNEYLIKQVAKFSGGSSEIVTPKERIEPKIIGLFEKVKGYSIHDLKILCNGSIEKAPASVSIFQNDTISIFAKTQSNTSEITEVTIEGTLGHGSVAWSIPIYRIGLEGEFIPKLWAREMINDLEHMPIEGSGSKQESRKQNLIKDRIIKIAKEHGIVSNETSFVAIEKRIDAEKTTAESVLRKVPVMLTKDWGGIKSQNIANVFHATHRKIHDTRVYLCCKSRPKIEEILPDHPPIITCPNILSDDDIDIKILTLQIPTGGFLMDKEVAEMIGITLSEIRKISEKIVSDIKTDKFLLLSTAIILVYLKRRCDNEKYFMGSITEKTEKWLRKQIEEGKPTINGCELMKWAEEYIKGLPIVNFFETS